MRKDGVMYYVMAINKVIISHICFKLSPLPWSKAQKIDGLFQVITNSNYYCLQWENKQFYALAMCNP